MADNLQNIRSIRIIATLNCSYVKNTLVFFCGIFHTKSRSDFSVVIITQGGGVAAPVGGQILSEILPYLEVEQGNQDEVEPKIEIAVPDLIGKTIEEAENILKDNGLETRINNEVEGLDKSNTTVSNQLPQAGIIAYNGNCVYLDY